MLRRQEHPVMWPHREEAAGPGLLPQLAAAGAVAADFERPHET